MRTLILTIGLTGLATAPAIAADMEISIEIPRLDVAEYHKPYVAIWFARPDQSVAANLAVWYDGAKRDQEGQKWLKDLRQWWRRTGRDLTLPADGLTSATRAPGAHAIKFDAANPTLTGLAPGEYQLIIEAAREVGGREVLKIPLQWPPAKGMELSAKGSNELGTVSINVKP
jgi:hypothetical protein